MVHYSAAVSRALSGAPILLFFGALLLGVGLLRPNIIGIGLGVLFLAFGLYLVLWAISRGRTPQGRVFYCKSCKRTFSGDLAACPRCGALADPKAWWR